MKQQNDAVTRRFTIPKLSIAIVVFIVVFMPLYPFLTTWAGASFGEPLLWKVAKDVLLGVTFLGIGGWVLGDGRRRELLARDTLIWLVGLYALVAVVVTLFNWNGISESLLAGMAIHARYLAILLIVYLAVRYGELKFDINKLPLKFLAVGGVALAVIGIVQVFLLPLDTLEAFGYDKGATIAPFVLIDENPDAPRAFATLRGPNDYGAYLIMTIIAAAFLTLRDKRWVIGVFVMVFALVLSSSRSAMLGLFCAALAVAVIRYRSLTARAKRYALYGFGATIIAGILLLIAATTVPALQLAVFHSSPDDPSLTEGSTDEHWTQTGAGIDRAIADPLGCGFGCAGPASFYGDESRIAENWFVQVAEEFGIIGLITWIVLFTFIMVQLYTRRHLLLAQLLFASAIGLSVVGVWLHVWADDPISLTWWALAGAALAMIVSTSTGSVAPKQVDYTDETQPKTAD